MALKKQGFLFSARAPAKVLLTGEHSVVYGAPSLAMAVNRFASTEIRARKGSGIFFDLKDFKNSVRLTLSTLRRIHNRLIQAFETFKSGKRSISQVLRSPFELFEYTLASLLDICKIELQAGLDINVHSTIPVGCGMGSSAATTVSFVKALLYHFGIDKGLDWIEKLIFETEKLQHGQPSGVDAFISLHGGCVKFQKGHKPQPLSLPTLPLWVVNTGTPESTTGECVCSVRKKWGGTSIWNEFAQATSNIEQAITSQDIDALCKGFADNQRLLSDIGVVPAKVARFVKEIEHIGGCAKISGAGSIRGDSAGIVLVFAPTSIEQLCSQFGYTYFCLEGESQGASIDTL